ncbi:hypothetical protein BDD12DRAFT_897510 [Trichophaea hybrida]|nr:hypothetical protein BDD12DRAFT_897510 [Trichophaea hybrida]
MSAGDGKVTVPGKSPAVMPSLWSKDGTDGLGAVPSVLGKSRTAHRPRPSDGTVDITVDGSTIIIEQLGFSSNQYFNITHKAVARIAATLSTKVAGIVLFGDPDNGQPFPGVLKKNVLTFCNVDDPICFGIPLPILSHQKYKTDAVKAAAWVAGKV